MNNQTLNVEDVMTSLVHTCQVGDSLERAAQLLWENDCGCLPVVDTEGVVRSMITDRDICMAAYTGGCSLRELRVEDSMSGGLVACRADDELAAAAGRMAAHQLRRLPVVDDAGRVRGVLSVNDLACCAAEGCADAIGDHAAAESLRILMAACRHRSAQDSESMQEVAEIHPPPEDGRQPFKKSAKAEKARSARHESAN